MNFMLDQDEDQFQQSITRWAKRIAFLLAGAAVTIFLWQI